MQEEISLLAVILIVFLADLFLCGKEEKACVTTGGTELAAAGCGCGMKSVLPIALMILHTIITLLPWGNAMTTPAEAFGGMYLHTPMMTIVKSVLNVGVIIVMLMSSAWLERPETASSAVISTASCSSRSSACTS